jgi:hypothetical protein
MEYPTSLQPDSTERIKLSQDRAVEIRKTRPRWKLLTGAPVSDTYGGKPVLDYGGEPAFAELVILREFQKAGWHGVWVDTYRDKYRIAYWEEKGEVYLPPDKERLLGRIRNAAGSKHGCWDVFCWTGEMMVFAEAKRRSRDQIRDTQQRWLAAALDMGVPLESLLIVEWSLFEN